MSEIATYCSSFISHSLRIVLHLWNPEPKHRILSGRERSMSRCVAWGGGGMFSVVSCFFKLLRNCQPSQRVSKIQCNNFQLSDYGSLIVVTSSTFLKRKDVLKGS